MRYRDQRACGGCQDVLFTSISWVPTPRRWKIRMMVIEEEACSPFGLLGVIDANVFRVQEIERNTAYRQDQRQRTLPSTAGRSEPRCFARDPHRLRASPTVGDG